MNNAGTCFNIATTCQIDTAYLYQIMICHVYLHLRCYNQILSVLFLSKPCLLLCEVQSSDIVSSVCQTVNIDCAIND